MHLHPGTTYQFFIRASTVKGFGPATAINVTTNISGKQISDTEGGRLMLLVRRNIL
jgi:receptor-type tyrosine-protein phosphatase kappa